MPRYHVTIFGKDYDAMADLVREHQIDVFRETTRELKEEGGYSVDASVDSEQIRTLETKGYKIERHENLDEVGKARQDEVSKFDRFKHLDSLADEDRF